MIGLARGSMFNSRVIAEVAIPNMPLGLQANNSLNLLRSLMEYLDYSWESIPHIFMTLSNPSISFKINSSMGEEQHLASLGFSFVEIYRVSL